MKTDPRIFISYRRQDTAAWAGRIRDRLIREFDARNIFMDVDGIAAGSDFTKVLNDRISDTDVFICLIGRNWTDGTEADGTRRLDNPNDFVRLEVAGALANDNVQFLPVLVDGARMPLETQLPEGLRALARRQGLEIRHEKFALDAGELVRAIRREPTVEPLPKEDAERKARVDLEVKLVGLSLAPVTLVAFALITKFAYEPLMDLGIDRYSASVAAALVIVHVGSHWLSRYPDPPQEFLLILATILGTYALALIVQSLFGFPAVVAHIGLVFSIAWSFSDDSGKSGAPEVPGASSNTAAVEAESTKKTESSSSWGTAFGILLFFGALSVLNELPNMLRAITKYFTKLAGG